jgi:Fe2+ transport system protein FeoA
VIPGRSVPYGELTALADLPAGSTATIRRISEVAEHDAPQVLRQLEAIGLVPGAVVSVDEGGAGVGAVALSLGGETVALGYDVARLVHAEPV